MAQGIYDLLQETLKLTTKLNKKLCCEPVTTTSTTTVYIPCSSSICGLTYEGYGYLYNWFAIFGGGGQTNGGRNVGGIVNTSQPYGDERNQWRVPSEEDWNNLIGFLDPSHNPNVEDGPQSTIAGGKLKSICTAPFTINNGLWQAPNTGATNEFNWNAIPGGRRDDCDGFSALGFTSHYWSTGEYVPGLPWRRFLASSNSNIIRFYTYSQDGNSIRLVRPVVPLSPEASLPDGTTSNQNPILPHYIGNSRSYITVKIGNQVWTAQNLIDTTFNNGVIIPESLENSTWCSATTALRSSYNNGTITLDQGQIELCVTPI
jgi:uncharacterized protein (TIGR02145 family)